MPLCYALNKIHTLCWNNSLFATWKQLFACNFTCIASFWHSCFWNGPPYSYGLQLKCSLCCSWKLLQKLLCVGQRDRDYSAGSESLLNLLVWYFRFLNQFRCKSGKCCPSLSQRLNKLVFYHVIISSAQISVFSFNRRWNNVLFNAAFRIHSSGPNSNGKIMSGLKNKMLCCLERKVPECSITVNLALPNSHLYSGWFVKNAYNCVF